MEYHGETWGDHLLSGNGIRAKGGSSSLSPEYFPCYGNALLHALELSERDDCDYLVSMLLNSYDRH